MSVKMTLRSLLSEGVHVVSSQEDYVARVWDMCISEDEFLFLNKMICAIGVTDQFIDVIKTFTVPAGETPPGFKRGLRLQADGLLQVDLIRDIAYDKNGVKRPTNLLFSADSANPYEVRPISKMLANLTCNPGIVYDLFINNPKANVGNVYKNRDEVMEEIGKILGPGCDISVELNNPFNPNINELLEEAAKFREMFSNYRVVIKVPHTGPVNAQNVGELLEGNKMLSRHYGDVVTEDALRGHNLALLMQENGYRVNFTLMFEPYQTMLALQAKPYFINSFIRHRGYQSGMIKGYLDCYYTDNNIKHIEDLRAFFIANDYLLESDANMDLLKVIRRAQELIEYRLVEEDEGSDYLDGIRHNLRCMRQCNLPDSRLIICSMEGDYQYAQIDKMLLEPEFEDMVGKVVLTAEPSYLAKFTSTNQVVSYQRRFMNAAKGMN